MIRCLFSALALCIAAPMAMAGMACPGVDIHDVGTPDWLSRDDILDNLQSQEFWVGINTTPHADGRQINRVAPESAASRAGLLPNDILLSVNDMPASTAGYFDSFTIGEEVTLNVKRNENALPLRLVITRTDPVHYAFATALESDENGCPFANLSNATPILRDMILNNVLTEDRVFRCNDAHDALAFMGREYEINEAYLVRGSRRLLLTVPRFGTACIAASALDGDALTDTAVRAFLLEAAGALFQYQEDNP